MHGHGEKWLNKCTEACVCPEHGTQLLYSRAEDLHACQDVDCRYGHGLEPVLLDEFIEMRQNAWARSLDEFKSLAEAPFYRAEYENQIIPEELTRKELPWLK